MCFVVTCWERADLLALVCGVFCEFVTFPIGILGQVWYLIVSIPDLCTHYLLLATGGGGGGGGGLNAFYWCQIFALDSADAQYRARKPIST